LENNSVGRRRGQKQQKTIDEDWDDDDFQYLITKNTMAESSLLNPTYTNLSTLLIQSMNVTHLDLDHVLRQVLGQARPRSVTTSKKRFFFGEPKAHWMNNKPPTYIGGGVGMVPIATATSENEKLQFLFQYSETYTTTKRGPFEGQVQPSADVNILAMFVADNPYCVEALYQLSMVFYRMGEMEKGNELLRRALFVHECAFHSNFRDEFFRSTKKQKQPRIMDATCPENAPFFLELFTLMQVASMMGCFPTSLAISQLLLALDPHRDYGSTRKK